MQYQIRADIPTAESRRLIHERNVLENVLEYALRLPLHERVMVWMWYRDGYTYRQIAAAFKIHETTAKRRLIRIATKLCDMKRADCVLKEPLAVGG